MLGKCFTTELGPQPKGVFKTQIGFVSNWGQPTSSVGSGWTDGICEVEMPFIKNVSGPALMNFRHFSVCVVVVGKVKYEEVIRGVILFVLSL